MCRSPANHREIVCAQPGERHFVWPIGASQGWGRLRSSQNRRPQPWGTPFRPVRPLSIGSARRHPPSPALGTPRIQSPSPPPRRGASERSQASVPSTVRPSTQTKALPPLLGRAPTRRRHCRPSAASGSVGHNEPRIARTMKVSLASSPSVSSPSHSNRFHGTIANHGSIGCLDGYFWGRIAQKTVS